MVEIVNASPFEALGVAVCFLHGTRFDQRTLAETMTLLAPPINNDQCFIFEHDGACIGFITWAHMSETSEAKFLKWDGFVDDEDWISGDRVWIMMECIAVQHLLPCIRLMRDRLRLAIAENDFQDCLHWVRDKGHGPETREIRYG